MSLFELSILLIYIATVSSKIEQYKQSAWNCMFAISWQSKNNQETNSLLLLLFFLYFYLAYVFEISLKTFKNKW